MTEMTDPSDALVSFQQALRRGDIDLHSGAIDPRVFLHVDRPDGAMRFTYVTLDGDTVTAFVEFVQVEPIDDVLCFQVGWAVPIAFRNQGRAVGIMRAAVVELKRGLGRNGIPAFHVEAVVGETNIASQRVAAQTISESSTQIIDKVSGLPALRYVGKF